MATGAKITNTALNSMLNRSFKATPDDTAFTRFRVGIGTTTPTNADTTLEIDVPITIDTTVDACDADTGWGLVGGGIEQNETVNTTAGEFKEGTGCLNLPTSGAAGVAGWQKTVTTFDINDTKDTLALWYYIAAQSDLTTSADAVRITLGTDGYANTNYYSFADTAISDAWNYLKLENGGETGTEGGGADETDIDRIEIAVRLDTDQTTNDMRMDFWHLATASDFYGSFMTNYPTFNTTNKEVTIRSTLTATQANGHLLTEVGIENSDATADLFSHTVHTQQSKSSKDVIIYENKYRGSA